MTVIVKTIIKILYLRIDLPLTIIENSAFYDS